MSLPKIAIHAGHIRHLDGWRGLAILMVLISHFGGPLSLGALGVHAFFVLSGLLTARVLFVAQLPLSTFFRRRAGRILPTLYVFLSMVYGAAAWLGFTDSAAAMLATATFMRSYVPVGADGWLHNLPLAHLWSLNVEEHAYLLLAAVAILVSRRLREGGAALLVSSLMCVGAYAWHRVQPPASGGTFYPTLTECAAFSILLSGSIQLLATEKRWVAPASLATICGVLVAIAVGAYSEKLTVQFLLVPALLAVMVNAMENSSAWLRKALGWGTLRWLGRRSFSIYLWQQPGHFVVQHRLLDVHPALVCLASVLVGWLSFVIIENPARRWIYGTAPGASTATSSSKCSAKRNSVGRAE